MKDIIILIQATNLCFIRIESEEGSIFEKVVLNCSEKFSLVFFDVSKSYGRWKVRD